MAQGAPRRTLLLDSGQVDAGKLLEVQQHHPHHQLRLEIEPLARPGMPQVHLPTTHPIPLQITSSYASIPQCCHYSLTSHSPSLPCLRLNAAGRLQLLILS